MNVEQKRALLLKAIALLISLFDPNQAFAGKVPVPSAGAIVFCEGLLTPDRDPAEPHRSSTDAADLNKREGPQLLMVTIEGSNEISNRVNGLYPSLIETAAMFNLSLPPASVLPNRTFAVDGGLRSKVFLGGQGQDLAAFLTALRSVGRLTAYRLKAPTILLDIQYIGEHPQGVFNEIEVFLEEVEMNPWKLVQLRNMPGRVYSFYFLRRTGFEELSNSGAFDQLNVTLHSWRRLATFFGDIKLEGRDLHGAYTENEQWVILPAEAYLHMEPSHRNPSIEMLTYLSLSLPQ